AVSTSIILTATVQAAATGNPTPTGTVTFFDGQTPLTGTSTSPNPATLANGTASYTTSSLAVGVHLLTAVYSGDMNFPGSSSQVLVETISSGKFSLSASPSSLTIPQGGSGSTTITITWEGYTGPPVTLSCQTLPNNAVCVFIPLNPPGPSSETVTLTPSGTGATVKLTIYTTGLNGVGSVGGPAGWLDLQSTRPGRVPPILPAAMLLLIGMLALAARQRNEKKWIARLALLALLAGLGMLTACYHYGTPILPGTRFTPTGQSTVVISASGGATTQTRNLTVTITPGQ
ncbi:MAG TPA: Ig-like domain-containing protein, partial [Candidatus Acidoferrales bacterium]|nr:Ig-like domain-containing protein [Candidatus Acidoferrales bacterium]